MPCRRGEAEATGVLSGEGFRTAGCGREGEDDTGIAKAQQGERRHRYALGADGTTPRGVDLVECDEFLAPTGRGYGRWHRRQLEMPQDTYDYRLLSDDGNDPQLPLMAK